MVCRSRRAPEHHYGWCNPKAGRLDPDDNPVSLLEGRRSNLAGSRFNDSQANRAAVDGASSRSPKTGPGVSGEETEAAGLLFAYRPDYFVFGRDHAFPFLMKYKPIWWLAIGTGAYVILSLGFCLVLGQAAKGDPLPPRD